MAPVDVPMVLLIDLEKLKLRRRTAFRSSAEPKIWPSKVVGVATSPSVLQALTTRAARRNVVVSRRDRAMPSP